MHASPPARQLTWDHAQFKGPPHKSCNLDASEIAGEYLHTIRQTRRIPRPISCGVT